MTGRAVRLRTMAAVAHPVADAGAEVGVLLEWRPADPLAVTASFDGGGTPSSWSIGRDLLHAGLARRAGDADVTAWPGLAGTLFLHLDNGARDMTLVLDADEAERFLARTFRLVPRGAETYDVDAVLASVLGGDGR